MAEIKTYKVINNFRRSYLIKGYGWLGQGQEGITHIRPNPARGLSIEELTVLDMNQVENLAKESNVPVKSWTEKKIKKWIMENAPDVNYDIRNDTKNDAFLRLKDKGYI